MIGHAFFERLKRLKIPIVKLQISPLDQNTNKIVCDIWRKYNVTI